MPQKACFLFLLLLTVVTSLPAQVASRTDGVAVFYYDSLHEAFAATTGTSIEQPDEITLLVDIVLDEPLTLDDGKHIRLVAGVSNRTIHRSPDLIDFPVLWVNGDSSSLTLGKPGMENELIIDGGYEQPIEARCPLIAVSGPGAKLIMYDKVTLQNNKNSGSPLGTSYYEHGSGVFIRTQGDIKTRQAEFIMKGGTIRGNINNIQTPLACGGGVFIAGFGIFTMEGGAIMNNTTRVTGGGFHVGGRGSFKKTGGIIYGSDAAAYRNTAIEGAISPTTYGHAVCLAYTNPAFLYRNDTVTEKDNLSYIGVPSGNGIIGEGEKWDNPYKAVLRMLLAIILPIFAAAVSGFLIYRKITFKKVMKIAQEAADKPVTVFDNVQLSAREKEIGKLLLTELSMKQITTVMHIARPTVYFHAGKLYRKMGVQNRTELLLKRKGMGSGE